MWCVGGSTQLLSDHLTRATWCRRTCCHIDHVDGTRITFGTGSMLFSYQPRFFATWCRRTCRPYWRILWLVSIWHYWISSFFKRPEKSIFGNFLTNNKTAALFAIFLFSKSDTNLMVIQRYWLFIGINYPYFSSKIIWV